MKLSLSRNRTYLKFYRLKETLYSGKRTGLMKKYQSFINLSSSKKHRFLAKNKRSNLSSLKIINLLQPMKEQNMNLNKL
jgi:hypothetical protein